MDEAYVNESTVIGDVVQGFRFTARSNPSGEPVLNVSVLTIKRGRRHFHRVALFGDLATRIHEALRVGAKVYAKGEMKARKYPSTRKPNVIIETVELHASIFHIMASPAQPGEKATHVVHELVEPVDAPSPAGAGAPDHHESH